MDANTFEKASRILLDRNPDDEQGRMLHSPGLKTAGKFYGFAGRDELVVKLPQQRVSELIDAGTGRPCEPRKGRPMREWVELSPADVLECVAYLDEARSFVASLTTDKVSNTTRKGDHRP